MQLLGGVTIVGIKLVAGDSSQHRTLEYIVQITAIHVGVVIIHDYYASPLKNRTLWNSVY